MIQSQTNFKIAPIYTGSQKSEDNQTNTSNHLDKSNERILLKIAKMLIDRNKKRRTFMSLQTILNLTKSFNQKAYLFKVSKIFQAIKTVKL